MVVVPIVICCYIDTVVIVIVGDRSGWYQRFENNGWRRIDETVSASCEN